MDLTAPEQQAAEPQSPASEPQPPRAGTRTRLDRAEMLAIALGGGAGALARAGLGEALPTPPGAWPWATFAANVAGALLLGWLITRLQERLPPSTLRRPLLGTGLCGALTTFSTMQVESVKLLEGGHAPLAVAYLAASIGAGLLAVLAASAVSRRVRRI